MDVAILSISSLFVLWLVPMLIRYRMMSLCVRELIETKKKLEEKNAALARLATIDDLSGILNRRTALDRMDSVFRAVHGTPTKFGILMIDVDKFKLVNDQFGHAAGDAVIRETARRIRSALRDCDVLGRYGGEEFVVMLPDTSRPDAARIARRIGSLVEATGMQSACGQHQVTVSIGMACLRDSDACAAEVIDRADQLMFRAKEAGRNCVRMDRSDVSLTLVS